MPWTPTESITHEERLDENRDRERYISSNRANGKDRSNSHLPCEYEEQKTDPDGRVEPNRVDGSVSGLVNALDPPRTRETSIARICESNSGRSDHAALAHGEATDNRDCQDREGDLLRHHLDEVAGPWLSEIRTNDGWDVDYGVGNDKLEGPAHEAAETAGHDDGARGGDGGIGAFF